MDVSELCRFHNPPARTCLAILATALGISAVNAAETGPMEPSDMIELSTNWWGWGKGVKLTRPVTLAAFEKPQWANDAQSIIGGVFEGSGDWSPLVPWEDVNEKKALAGQKNLVSRFGKNLVISTPKGGLVKFGDWTKREIPNKEEGDSIKFLYGGKYGKFGYHRVVANYQHDAPSTYFVNPKSGRTFRLGVGDRYIFASPSGDYIFAMGKDNPRSGFAVGNLTDQGPAIDISCVLEGIEKNGVFPIFRGWHYESLPGFDVAVIARRQDGGYEAVPLRFSKKADGWCGYTADPAATAKLVTIRCVQ
jgi:hypothetical protein